MRELTHAELIEILRAQSREWRKSTSISDSIKRRIQEQENAERKRSKGILRFRPF